MKRARTPREVHLRREVEVAGDGGLEERGRHPERFPGEINTAPVSELLRVPGVGPRSAKRIADLRRRERLRSVEALGALGVSCRIAAPFVLIDGKPAMRQMSLF